MSAAGRPEEPADPRDSIVLSDLRLLAYCGVLPEEQARRQPFELQVTVRLDLTPAGSSDDLADTINYGGLCTRIATLVASARFALLERFAQAVADVVLADPRAESVTVEVHKLRPPVPEDLRSCGVRITRRRAG